ncbi:hypothetical protein GW17_00031721, partial [Ensete ventricosum]
MCVSLSVSVGHGSTNSARDCTSGSSSSGLYLGLLLLWSMPLAPPPWVCASCSFSSSPFAGVMHKSTVGVGVFDVTPSTIKYLTDCTLDLTSVDVLGKADAYDRCGAKVWRLLESFGCRGKRWLVCHQEALQGGAALQQVDGLSFEAEYLTTTRRSPRWCRSPTMTLLRLHHSSIWRTCRCIRATDSSSHPACWLDSIT